MKQTLTGLCVVLALCGIAFAQAPALETTLDDQTDVAVTAYNNGLALVRDVRNLKLPVGEAELRFSDVPEKIRPQTVSLRSTAAPGSVQIIEQNYEYDLISPAKLMEKYVGKEVRLVNFSKELGFDVAIAELLSVNDGPVYRIGGEIFLGHPGNVAVPEIPENLIARPSLIWLVDNAQADQSLEVTYLTDGISWTADYVVTLAKDEASLDVAGWVTMNNQSGAAYTNAKLKLVAGDVNVIVQDRGPYGVSGNGGFSAGARSMPMPVEEAFAEYHLYTMPRRTTIKQNQSKQLALLNGSGIKCGKKYEFRGQLEFYSRPMPALEDQHVEVFLEFENEEENSLGIPLPAGVMRIYQEDSEGMLQFSGEDRIEHTPKDETVRLKMGNAFDVVADRVQKDYRKVSSNVHESAFEITVRNHKESGIVVDIVEPMTNDWKILDSSHEYRKKDARTAVFSVPVEQDGEVVITYRVRVKV
jgi:hypothetical protein